jgi:hypothetical protein
MTPRPAKKKKLEGKNIVIIGNMRETEKHEVSLKERGAKVSYFSASSLISPQGVETVARKILASQPPIDAVLIYKPYMEAQEEFTDSFETIPSIVFTGKLAPLNIPVLIVDDYPMDHETKARLKYVHAGAEFRAATTQPAEHVSILEQMANHTGRYKGRRPGDLG